MSQSVARNTAFITFASIAQKVISFVYFTLIARNIGAENTGKYIFALSFTTIFVVFVDLGLNQVLIREGAKNKENLQKYLSSVLFIKLFLGIFTYITAVVTINLMGYPIETRQLVYLSAVTMLFDSLHLSIYGVLRAYGNLKYEAWGIVMTQALTLIMGTIFLYLKFPLIFLILAFTIPSFINVCYATIILFIKYHISLRLKWDKVVMKFFLKITIPFALAAIFARVYSYIDSILLSKLMGDKEVGWYSIPYKITYAFQFIPSALVAVLYPKFSEYFVQDKNKLVYTLERGIKYLLIIVFPIVFGISILAKDIVLSLYTSEYLNSILPLKILLVGLIFSFISFPLGAFLNACNKQVSQTVIVFFIMLINIISNLILIPRLGVVGAAISALIGNFCLVLFSLFIIPKIAKISHSFIFKSLIQILLATLVMSVVVWHINLHFHYLIAVIVGGVVYILALFIFRVITKTQLKEVYLLINKKSSSA